MGNKPEVLHVGRTRHILEGTVQSRSDPHRLYFPRVMLSASHLCTCDGNQFRDSICVHLRAILEAIPPEELVDFIIQSQQIPEPIVPEEP